MKEEKYFLRKGDLSKREIKRIVSFYGSLYSDTYTKEALESETICFSSCYTAHGWAKTANGVDLGDYKEVTLDSYKLYKKKYNRALYLKVNKLLELEDFYDIKIDIRISKYDVDVEIWDVTSNLLIQRFGDKTLPSTHSYGFSNNLDISVIKENIEEWMSERDDKIKKEEQRIEDRERKQLEELSNKYNK